MKEAEEDEVEEFVGEVRPALGPVRGGDGGDGKSGGHGSRCKIWEADRGCFVPKFC